MRLDGIASGPSVLIVTALLVSGHGSPLRAQDVAGACDLVARLIEALPALELSRADTVVVDPVTGARGPGCQLRATGRTTAFGGGPSLDRRIREALPRQGWAEDHAYAADGPDGTAFAFRRGPVICVVRGRWDGGGDGDPSYVPDDRYELVAACRETRGPVPPGPGRR